MTEKRCTVSQAVTYLSLQEIHFSTIYVMVGLCARNSKIFHWSSKDHCFVHTLLPSVLSRKVSILLFLENMLCIFYTIFSSMCHTHKRIGEVEKCSGIYEISVSS